MLCGGVFVCCHTVFFLLISDGLIVIVTDKFLHALTDFLCFLRLSLSLYPCPYFFPLSSTSCVHPSPDAKHRAETELGPQTRPRSNTLPKSFGSTLDHSAHDAAGELKGPRPTREETLELIQCRVKDKREEDGWPDDIKVRTRYFPAEPLHLFRAPATGQIKRMWIRYIVVKMGKKNRI